MHEAVHVNSVFGSGFICKMTTKASNLSITMIPVQSKLKMKLKTELLRLAVLSLMVVGFGACKKDERPKGLVLLSPQAGQEMAGNKQQFTWSSDQEGVFRFVLTQTGADSALVDIRTFDKSYTLNELLVPGAYYDWRIEQAGRAKNLQFQAQNVQAMFARTYQGMYIIGSHLMGQPSTYDTTTTSIEFGHQTTAMYVVTTSGTATKVMNFEPAMSAYPRYKFVYRSASGHDYRDVIINVANDSLHYYTRNGGLGGYGSGEFFAKR